MTTLIDRGQGIVGPDADGWYVYRPAERELVRFRWGHGDHGRPTITDLWFTNPDGVDGTQLRTLAISMLDARMSLVFPWAP